MRNCVCLTSANDGLINESQGLMGETDVWSIGNMKLDVFCAGVRRSASCKWAGSLHPTAAMPVEARLLSMSFTFTGGKWLINHVAIYHLITVDSGTSLRVFTPHLCSCACISFLFFHRGIEWVSLTSFLSFATSAPNNMGLVRNELQHVDLPTGKRPLKSHYSVINVILGRITSVLTAPKPHI